MASAFESIGEQKYPCKYDIFEFEAVVYYVGSLRLRVISYYPTA